MRWRIWLLQAIIMTNLIGDMTTYEKILAQKGNDFFTNGIVIKTIDMHTGGEPLRVIMDGFPEIKGENVLECRRYVKANYDHLRKALMFEPRGHADMYGCLLIPPNDEGADFGILFLHNEGYSTMCGHAIIAIATLAVRMNWIDVEEGDNCIKIDAPCGRIIAYANVHQNKVRGVKFHCVPSFVVGLDRKVTLPGIGDITYDLAYGGAFYAYVDLDKNDLPFDLTTNSYRHLIKYGMALKRIIMEEDRAVIHPYEADLSFLYGTIFIGKALDPANDSRNVCVFAEGEVDRCPTGSGVSGRMAIHHARGEITDEVMCIESITGSVFKGSVYQEVAFGPHKAVIPQVIGAAFVTGSHTFYIDPDDPINEGFLLR